MTLAWGFLASLPNAAPMPELEILDTSSPGKKTTYAHTMALYMALLAGWTTDDIPPRARGSGQARRAQSGHSPTSRPLSEPGLPILQW